MKQTGRKLDIVLRSAAGLKKVNTSRMAAYAVAWIEPSLRVPSPMDKRHGRNPVWDTTISMIMDEKILSHAGRRLHIELLGQGLVSTKPIGFVTVDMTDILLKGSEGAAVRAPFPDYPVRRRSGRQQGILNFELCLQASSSHASSGASQEEFGEDISPAASSSSAPPRLPHYQRDLSMEPQQTYEMGRNHFSRDDMDMDMISYGSAVPTATTSMGEISEHEEIPLLDSSDRASVVSQFR